MVQFVSMTKPEAEEYFQRFMAEMPACARRLADTAAATGGPSPESLEHAPESLGPLWDWAAARLAWREGYEPPALGMPGLRIDAEDLEPADQLPSWFHHPSGVGYARFSPETLWLLDGIGRYAGNTLVQTVPRTRWKVGHARTKGYMFQNQPVVAGLGEEIMPIQTCAVLADKALNGGQRSLRAAFDNWLSRRAVG